MKLSGHKTRKALFVLLTGVCLAANGLCATDNSTSKTPPKPATPPAARSAHPTPAHRVATKAVTPATASHSAAHRPTPPHAGTVQSATAHSATVHSTPRTATLHASYTSAAKRTPSRTTTPAAHRRSSTAYSRRVHTLTGQQRLARLHLQPERTQEIQQALIREGYLQGDANGQWDGRTHDAMMHYQVDHGFPATGLPEAKSLMKLGLGSHPLPADLDHGPVGVGTPAAAAPGDLTVTPTTPPGSQASPPS